MLSYSVSLARSSLLLPTISVKGALTGFTFKRAALFLPRELVFQVLLIVRFSFCSADPALDHYERLQ